MTHADFIALAYGFVAVGVVGLVIYIWADLRRQSRQLAELEAKGTARRRAAMPVEPRAVESEPA